MSAETHTLRRWLIAYPYFGLVDSLLVSVLVAGYSLLEAEVDSGYQTGLNLMGH